MHLYVCLSHDVFYILEHCSKQDLSNKITTTTTTTVDEFIHGRSIIVVVNIVLTNTATAPIRKHFPVSTELILRNQARKVDRKLPRIRRNLDINILKENVDTTLNRKTELIEDGKINEAAKILKQTVKNAQIVEAVYERKAQPWFDQECYTERQKVLHHLHRARNSHLGEDLQQYNKKRRAYNKTLRKKRETSFKRKPNNKSRRHQPIRS